MLTIFPVAAAPLDAGPAHADPAAPGADVLFRQVLGRLVADPSQTVPLAAPPSRADGSDDLLATVERSDQATSGAGDPGLGFVVSTVAPVRQAVGAEPRQRETVPAPLASSAPVDAALRVGAAVATQAPHPLADRTLASNDAGEDKAKPTSPGPGGPVEGPVRHRIESALSRVVLESRLQPATLPTSAPAPVQPVVAQGQDVALLPAAVTARVQRPQAESVARTPAQAVAAAPVPHPVERAALAPVLPPGIERGPQAAATHSRHPVLPPDPAWQGRPARVSAEARQAVPTMMPSLHFRQDPPAGSPDREPTVPSRPVADAVAQSPDAAVSRGRSELTLGAFPSGWANSLNSRSLDSGQIRAPLAPNIAAPAAPLPGNHDLRVAPSRPGFEVPGKAHFDVGHSAARSESVPILRIGPQNATAPAPVSGHDIPVSAERIEPVRPDASQPDLPLADTLRPESARSEPTRIEASRPEPARIDTPRPGLPAATVRQIAEALPPVDGPGFDLALNPEELGHVRLRLTGVEGGSLLVIHAERPETLDLLRRHVAALEQDLRDLGHEGLMLRFSAGGGSGDRGHQAPPQASAALDHPAPRADPSRTATTVALDEVRGAGSDHLDLRL